MMAEKDVLFNIDAFVDELATYVCPEGDSGQVSKFQRWEHVGRRALAKSRRVPVPNFMYISLVP
jgi:hypothetical protein